MAQCPKCAAPVADDFGLIECNSCHAQLLVQIDGSVEMATAEPAVNDEAAAPAEGGLEAGGAEFEELYEDVPFESSEEQSDDSAAEPDDLYQAEDDGAEEYRGDDFAEGSLVESEEPSPADPPPMDAYPDFDEPEPSLTPVPAYDAAAASPDLSDLARFGNSDVSSAREGALRYNVRVSGIDTVDVRDAFREALTDRKFVWDTDHILRTIKNGECRLSDVTATKAHVLIARLRTLPVEVEWEQYAIHQA